MIRLKKSDGLFKVGTDEWNQVYKGDHFELSENAARILEDRYLLKDPDQFLIENFEELLKRVTTDIASVEKNKELRDYWSTQFFSITSNGLFLPASPTLMNAGRGNNGSYPACFVLDVVDDLAKERDSIFGAMVQMAEIHKNGGGTGCSFSKLRPASDLVSSTNGAASGPVSFMQVFNWVIAVVMQGGMRRGAHMSILRVDHPDIEEFITCKGRVHGIYGEIFSTLCNWLGLDETGPIAKVFEKVLLEHQLRHMNISVGLTRDFKRALVHSGTYDLLNPRTGTKVGEKNAHEIMDLIVEYAWRNGEPGWVDLERINDDNPLPNNEIESTNPCGEQPLEAWESCNLGSINVSKMALIEPLDREHFVGKFDWDKFDETVKIAVRFLDNVIDATPYPYKHIEQKSKANRKIGLGFMGFADLLFLIGIPYNSAAAVDLCNEISARLTAVARETSSELAKEKGAFPAWKDSCFPSMGLPEYRNATVTTIAPTGSISTIAGCSSAIEPIFRLAYERHIMDQVLIEVNPYFLRAMEAANIPKYVLDRVLETGSCQDVPEIPEYIRNIFVTAADITSKWHVDMLCAAQGTLNPEDPDGVENAVSKTINFPFEATRTDVKAAFTRALENGAKGLTIYRSGSREIEVLRVSQSGKRDSFLQMAKRDNDEMPGTNVRFKIGECGKFYFNITEDEQGRPFEIFFVSEHKGMECANIGLSNNCRMASVMLRYGVKPEEVARHLLGVKCSKYGKGVGPIGKTVTSCYDAAAKALLKYAEDKKKQDDILEQDLKRSIFGRCPYCGTQLQSAGGRCISCPGCEKYYTCT